VMLCASLAILALSNGFQAWSNRRKGIA
jgi:hypothetical protein